MRKAMLWAAALAALMGTMPAVAAEDCAATAARLAEAWRARAPVTGLSGIDAATAACVQKTLVQNLAADAGQPVGYKVGLTSQVMQDRLGVGHPVSGVLLGGMLREPITPIPADFAARPMVEADLVAVIGDDGVNQAKTPAEVLAHLAALQPFIELSDLVLAPTEKPTAEAITAINVGARLGVLGPAIPIEPSLADRLATMKVSLTDETGKVLTEAPGSAVLGNPLNAVIWLAQDLAARGEALQPGQRVSLGSFGAPTQPVRGGVVTLRYDGLLLAPVTLVVRFE